MIKKIICIFILVILFLSCNNSRKKDSNTIDQSSGNYNNSNVLGTKTNTGDNNYHTDPNYNYESRTGSNGNYNYNYDINGTDMEGNNVTGNIEISGKSGSGTIIDDNGNEMDVDVEWVNKGVLEGTDEDGNTYDLEVE